jgi:opacity protein-like surface antigen
MKVTIAGVLMILLLSPVCVLSGEPELKPSPTEKIIWVDGIGSGFRKGLYQVGSTIGAGFGTKVFGTTQKHDLASASMNVGWVFTDVIAADKWYRGNLELLVELFAGGQFNPYGRYFVGLTPFIRYNFATGSRWMPFVEFGAGVSATNIEGPDLTGTFQFNLQPGAGLNYFISKRTALTVQYRWLHFSNARIALPNHGTNTQMFEVGVSWFF